MNCLAVHSPLMHLSLCYVCVMFVLCLAVPARNEHGQDATQKHRWQHACWSCWAAGVLLVVCQSSSLISSCTSDLHTSNIILTQNISKINTYHPQMWHSNASVCLRVCPVCSLSWILWPKNFIFTTHVRVQNIWVVVDCQGYWIKVKVASVLFWIKKTA